MSLSSYVKHSKVSQGAGSSVIFGHVPNTIEGRRGRALFAMGGMKKHGTDLALAWPLAELAVMGAEEAVDFLYKDELGQAPNRIELKRKLAEEYDKIFANPYYVARRMVIHDVIEPRETRKKIIAGLRYFDGKKEARLAKKHGNMPL